jgi:cysteine-rich repeat protein
VGRLRPGARIGLAAALFLAAAGGCGDDGGAAAGDGGPDSGGGVDGGPDGGGGGGWEQVFDPAVLHHVEITIAASDLERFDYDPVNRIPCDVVYDGVALPMSNCRKKGGIGSLDPSSGKPAFSIKFDDLVPGQELHGLDKIVLNNEISDPTLLDEHLAYASYRRAGIPAHHSAHALVTFNGVPRGIYLAVESYDKEFLRHAFGAANDQGNLYEGAIVDFADSPDDVELKHEVEEGRSRDDIRALAAAVNDTPAEGWEAAVGALADLERFERFFALDAMWDDEDGYCFGKNNYYLYDNPVDGKFVMLPHGMDVILLDPAFEPDYPPYGVMARRLREVPALDAAYHAAIAAAVAPGGAFDLDEIETEIDQVTAVLDTAEVAADDARTAGDLAQYRARVAAYKTSLGFRRDWLTGTQPLPRCGDGVISRGEECDDGNSDATDGCDSSDDSAPCAPTCVAVSGPGGHWALCPAQVSQPDAQAECQAIGGVLGVPEDEATVAFLSDQGLRHFGSVDFWLGVSDEADEGTWRTLGGAAVTFLPWGPTEPNGETQENCALLDTSYNGLWRDRLCGEPYVGALCKLP